MMFKKILRVLLANLGLIIRKIFGIHVIFSVKNLVSVRADLRTYGMGQIILKNKVEIRPNSELTARDGFIEIGDTCFINRNCMIVAHERITMGNHVTIGPGTCIYDHDHDGVGGYVKRPIVIGDNTWIGAGCIILKGVTIGKNVTVAAGSVITNNIPDNVTIYQKRETILK